MNIVSYGGGANSTALLVGLHQHRIPVDLILFADTGAEHPHTYAYLNIMDRWLKDHGMPPIIHVYKYTQDGKRLTLEDECLQSGTLPSIAYGYKRCSLKHKIGPQEKFCNNHPACRKVWDSGKRVVKFVGYDGLFERIYEDNLSGKLSDERYAKMSQRYEEEQAELSERIKHVRKDLDKLNNKTTSTDHFLSTVRQYTRAKKLTPRMLNELIERIEVHQAEKIDGEWVQKLTIHYNCIGALSIPDTDSLPIPDVTVNTRQGVFVTYQPAQNEQ